MKCSHLHQGNVPVHKGSPGVGEQPPLLAAQEEQEKNCFQQRQASLRIAYKSLPFALQKEQQIALFPHFLPKYNLISFPHHVTPTVLVCRKCQLPNKSESRKTETTCSPNAVPCFQNVLSRAASTSSGNTFRNEICSPGPNFLGQNPCFSKLSTWVYTFQSD